MARTTPAEKTINKLQIGGYLKLADWWKTQHAAMVAARRTYQDAAMLARNDLKADIAACHCQRVARELEMPLESAHSKLGKSSSAKDRLARIEHLVAHLYHKLGEAMPSESSNGQAH